MNALEIAGRVAAVIVDTPPVARDVVMLAAGVADLVVIPEYTGSGDVAQVAQTQHLLALPLRAKSGLQVRAVLNHTGTAAVTREALEGVGIRAAEREIPYRRAYVIAKGSAPGHALASAGPENRYPVMSCKALRVLPLLR